MKGVANAVQCKRNVGELDYEEDAPTVLAIAGTTARRVT